ncbi:MAG: CoA transferase [Candidatus Bathyarchaeota archaeon]|jgi:formyl-CoA transferase|nr:CoA transferase [Candidatus Bathyarchaeota archaeon]
MVENSNLKGYDLHDIRVLDLTRVLAGPYCSMLLADLGADVIKLEIPNLGDDSRQFPPFQQNESMYYANLNRGKRSITMNLKHQEGKRLFRKLIEHCDILMENFRPGTLERLGIGYDQLKKDNPRLIYASISGFGRTGRYKDRPGYDIIGQAMGGLLAITGWPNSPPTRTGTAIADVLSALFCCVGILSALHIRNQTGEGQLIDVALVDSVVASLENIPQQYFVSGEPPHRIGNRYEFIYPYDSFRAADGWVIIGIANDVIWNRFVEVLHLSNVDDLHLFTTNPQRVQHNHRLKLLIEAWTITRQVKELVAILNTAGVPAAPIYSIKDVVEDPHIVIDRQMFIEETHPRIGKVTLSGNPIKMSETKPKPRGPAPQLGQHTMEILTQLLHLERKEVDALHLQGII